MELRWDLELMQLLLCAQLSPPHLHLGELMLGCYSGGLSGGMSGRGITSLWHVYR